jgi:predicted lipoprotein with Yx(FWY)xxD motif
MHSLRNALVPALGLSVAVAAQAASPLPLVAASGLVTSADGMTLYTYDRDPATGGSACSGPCAVLWPPYRAAAGAVPAAGFSLIERADGRLQWAWKGRPLYRYAGDSKPGSTAGDRMNGVWHVAH